MNIKSIVRYGLIGLIFLSSTSSIWLVYRYISTLYTINQTAANNVTRSVDEAVLQLEHQFTNIMKTINELSQWITTKNPTENELTQHIEQILKNNPTLYGIVFGYVPYAIDKQKKLYGPYFVKTNGTIERHDITYDYTLPSAQAGARTEWYNDAIRQNKVWAEPFYGTASKKHVVTYSERLYNLTDKQKLKPIGVVGAVISLDHLRTLVNALELGYAGYAFAISQKGFFAAHPYEEYYLKEKNIFDLAKEKNDKQLQTIAAQITNQPNGTFAYVDSASGQQARMVHRIIPSTNMILAATFLKSESITPYVKMLRRTLLYLVIMLTLTLALLTILVLLKKYTQPKWIVIGTFLLSGIFMLSIMATWIIVRNYALERADQQNMLLNQHMITKVTNNISRELHDKKLILIKTGLLLKSMRYISNNQIQISGLIWQRYPLSMPAHIAHDFIIPASERFDLKEVLFKQKNDHEELITWAFSCPLALQQADAQLYPFDGQNVQITIDHPAINNSAIVLIPDLASYNVITPQLLPGLQPTLHVEGRVLIESFFKLCTSTQNIHLRTQAAISSNRAHHLCFSIISNRLFGEILLVYLLPIFVALIFLGIIPFFVQNDRKNSLGAISLTAGIFLAMALTHSMMHRSVIESGNICYLDYYYILLYIFICIVVAAVAIRYIFDTKNHATLLELLLWPLYLFVAFIITIITFFA